MRKIIAVAVPKGGAGKTTTAVNLAASLAVAEKKTLLIDFDPSGACSIYLGFDLAAHEGDIFDVFTFTKHISKVIHKTELPNLDFIPTNISSLQKEERLARLTNNPYLFTNILNHDELLGYEFIIIDCPPYIKGLTTIALTAAKSILVPVRAGQISLIALKKMFEHIKWIKSGVNKNLAIEGILLTMYEPNTKAWTLTRDELQSKFGDYIFKTVIPKNVSMPESEFFGKPAVLFNATSKGALAYLALAQEIISRYTPKEEQKIPLKAGSNPAADEEADISPIEEEQKITPKQKIEPAPQESKNF